MRETTLQAGCSELLFARFMLAWRIDHIDHSCIYSGGDVCFPFGWPLPCQPKV
uniref:Uncharacterized protein n=1 Tax=Arundo donax TaxID=35708 RepID=A0A0A9CRS3_ARUDO